MKTIKNNAEFGVELALAVPYAYWLHLHNKLKTIITSKGMKPFYYFCDDVREEFNYRTIDNAAAGLNDLPNNWIHHNTHKIFGKDWGDLSEKEQFNANGVLDYSEWECPPYNEYYKNDEFKLEKPTIFITNKFNLEHGETPYGYFDIEVLYNIFNTLKDKGYDVIYKRSSNREEGITIDQNEINSLNQGFHDIKANIEGVGVTTDYQLCKYFSNVTLIDDIINESKYSYNETQLKLMANSFGFITVCGGNSILSSLFKKPTISYVHKGKELRPNYFGPKSYFQKISNNNVHPSYDVMGHINDETYNYKVNNTGKNDYSEVFKLIKQLF